MYREDIDQMSDITISKMDNIHGVSGLMMVIVIQLIMAGRLGVHGPAPSGWRQLLEDSQRPSAHPDPKADGQGTCLRKP